MNPQICVLLATFNGRQWIENQLDSILLQDGVCVTIFVSDDGSTDGTFEFLVARCASEPRLKMLPSRAATGHSARNFERLIATVEFSLFDFAGFSDQDDIWLPSKLLHAVRHLQATGAAGYSSNVTALTAKGKQKLISKAQPQVQFDHYFESASAGSTFLLTKELAIALQIYLRSPYFRSQTYVRSFSFHDWFIYCFARCAGFIWTIDERSLLLYRQHDRNEVGANIGMRAILTRIRKVKAGWYMDEVRWLCKVMQPLATASGTAALRPEDVVLNGIFHRLNFVAYVGRKARRRPRDRWALCIAALLGLAN